MSTSELHADRFSIMLPSRRMGVAECSISNTSPLPGDCSSATCERRTGSLAQSRREMKRRNALDRNYFCRVSSYSNYDSNSCGGWWMRSSIHSCLDHTSQTRGGKVSIACPPGFRRGNNSHTERRFPSAHCLKAFHIVLTSLDVCYYFQE